MILYHGTAAPLRFIKEDGLKVFSKEYFMRLMVSRVRDPKRLGPVIARILSGIVSGEAVEKAIYFTTDKEMAKAYIGIPEQLGYQFAIGPKRVALELWRALVEVEGDFLVGKVVTVDVPDEWKDKPGVNWEPSDEISFPWDVGPEYITKIEVISFPWVEIVAGVEELID